MIERGWWTILGFILLALAPAASRSAVPAKPPQDTTKQIQDTVGKIFSEFKIYVLCRGSSIEVPESGIGLFPKDESSAGKMKALKQLRSNLASIQDALPAGGFSHTYDPNNPEGGISGLTVTVMIGQNRPGQAPNAPGPGPDNKGANGLSGAAMNFAVPEKSIVVAVTGNGQKGGNGVVNVITQAGDPVFFQAIQPGQGGQGGAITVSEVGKLSQLIAVTGDGGDAGDAGVQVDKTQTPESQEVGIVQGASGGSIQVTSTRECNNYCLLGGNGATGSTIPKVPKTKLSNGFVGGDGGQGGDEDVTTSQHDQSGAMAGGNGGDGGKGVKTPGKGGRGGNATRSGTAVDIAAKPGEGGRGEPNGAGGTVTPAGNTF